MKRFFKNGLQQKYLVIIAISSVLLLVGGASFALFTMHLEYQNTVGIKTGTLTGELKVNGTVTDKLTVNQGENKEFTVTLRNNNDRAARYLLYYTGTLPSGLEVGYIVGDNVVAPPETNGRNITKETTETYKIKVKNNTTSSQTIQLKLDVGLEKVDLKVPSDSHLFEKMQFSIPEDTPMREYINSENAEFNENTKNKMFVYHHEAGEQQVGWIEEELTDYRYIGANPNNYVTFNGETAGWRIIGVFTVENEKGEKEQRIKLIRKESIGSFSWDNKLKNEGSSENDNGSNNWTDSRLMMLLNPGYEANPLAAGGKGSLYWNRETGKCPLGENGATVDCDFISKGLTPEAQEMIGDAKWYLGGIENYDSATEGIAKGLYRYERGTETCNTKKTCTTNREPYWIGKIGLIYPSDYGYATSGGESITKDQCLAVDIYHWSSQSNCYTNNWLYVSDNYQWTITPRSNYSYDILVFKEAITRGHGFEYGSITRPVVYLLPNVQIIGTGSQDDPFVFAT